MDEKAIINQLKKMGGWSSLLESIFFTVNEWMVSGTAIAGVGCFTWGMISVLFSPCHSARLLIVAYVGGQEQALNPKQAGVYSFLFTLGLFISIALIGIVCALLGRMLGDIGNYWQILVGAVLIWVALGMLGVENAPVGQFAVSAEFEGFIGGLCAWPGLRYSFRFLHLRLHRSDFSNHHPSAKNRHRHPVNSPVCPGTLSAHRGGRQLNSCRSEIDGKQHLARSRHLVSACGRFSSCSFGCVFYP